MIVLYAHRLLILMVGVHLIGVSPEHLTTSMCLRPSTLNKKTKHSEQHCMYMVVDYTISGGTFRGATVCYEYIRPTSGPSIACRCFSSPETLMYNGLHYLQWVCYIIYSCFMLLAEIMKAVHAMHH